MDIHFLRGGGEILQAVEKIQSLELELKDGQSFFDSLQMATPSSLPLASMVSMVNFLPLAEFFLPVLRIWDPGVKKAPDPGSGSATLLSALWLVGRGFACII
jgi:hypothetical protein